MQLYERNIWILTVLVENIGGISNMCIYGLPDAYTTQE